MLASIDSAVAVKLAGGSRIGGEAWGWEGRGAGIDLSDSLVMVGREMEGGAGRGE